MKYTVHKFLLHQYTKKANPVRCNTLQCEYKGVDAKVCRRQPYRSTRTALYEYLLLYVDTLVCALPVDPISYHIQYCSVKYRSLKFTESIT